MLLIPYSLLTFTLIQCSIYRTKPGNTFAWITLTTHACTNIFKILPVSSNVGISRKERERMRDLARIPQRPGAAIPPPPLLTQPSHPPVVDEMGFEVERPLSSPEPSPTNSPSHVQPDSWDDGSNPVTFSKPAVTFSKPRVEKPAFDSKTLIGPTQGSWNSTKPSTTKATSGIGAKIMAK